MKTKILKVIAQTETIYVQSKKIENGQVAKCCIRLRELGGEYEDESDTVHPRQTGGGRPPLLYP